VNAITIDGLGEEDFRRSIESMLRHGQADAAAKRLRVLLTPYVGEGDDLILPDRFLAVSSADVTLAGWDALAASIARHDRPGQRISALSITIAEGDGTGPNKSGMLRPAIQTSYFTDEAYPFSDSARDDLLDGYSQYQSEWQGNSEGTDRILSVEGIDDLYGALARLEARLLQSPEPSMQEICAGTLGACYLAVLLHQAVHDAVRRGGLPRPLCIMAGNAGVYPYFDAPVMSCEECRLAGVVARLPIELPPSLADAEEMDDEDDEDEEDEDEEEEDEEEEEDDGAHSYGSLLSLGSSMRKKKPVIVLNAADAAAASQHYEVGAAHCLTVAGSSDRIGVLPGLSAAAFDLPEVWEEPEVPNEFAGSYGWREPEPDDLRGDPGSFEKQGLPNEPDEPAHDVHLDGPPLPEFIQASDLEIATEAKAEAEGDDRDEVEPRPLPEVLATEVPSPPAVAPPAGHSLRMKVVQHQEPHDVTLSDRIWAFFDRLRDWIMSVRK
jgi:hypothetical protein